MCKYMSVYVCIHVCMCIHLHMHASIYICSYIGSYVCVFVYECRASLCKFRRNWDIHSRFGSIGRLIVENNCNLRLIIYYIICLYRHM